MSNYAEGINRMWEEVEGKRTKPEHTEYDSWEKLKAEYYGKKCCAQSEWRLIDFNPDERLAVAGGEKPVSPTGMRSNHAAIKMWPYSVKLPGVD